MGCSKTHSQARRCWHGVSALIKRGKQFRCRSLELSELSALDRFHDNDIFPMAHRSLIAAAGLGNSAFPVKVIDLKLNHIHFRMFCQNPVQRLCIIVVGKTDFPRFSFFLHPAYEFKAPVGGRIDIAVSPDVMKKIYVKVIHAASFQLFGKIPAVII